MITPARLRAFAGHCDADALAPLLDAEAARRGIDTPARAAAWMGQMAVECAYFTVFSENFNYSAEALTAAWPARFPAEVAANYAHNPPRIADRAYAGRMGNGDEASGDGWRFRGRGVLQITGRANYARMGELTGLALPSEPDLLLAPANGILAAGAFWQAKALNSLADEADIEAITRAVNGGLGGLAARLVATNAFRALCNR
jgi:putative chitinase